MSASPHSSGAIPVIAWLGSPPPQGVAESLADIAEIRTEWTPEVQLIAVWAAAGVDQLRKLPRRTRRPPVIAAAGHDPSHGERMAWIRAGADDLVSLSALPVAVARRLQAAPSAAESEGDPEGLDHTPVLSRRRDPTSLVEPLGMGPDASDARGAPATGSEPGGLMQRSSMGQSGTGINSVGAASSAGRSRATHDAFPPLRVPQPDGGIPANVGPWVSSVQRYLDQREQWVGRWGKDGLDRLLEMIHVRSQVPAAVSSELSYSPFGHANGTSHVRVGWPLLVRRGPTAGRQIEVAEAEVLHAGTDGLVLDIGFEALEKQKLVADLMVSERSNAQILLEARWQRRVTPRRWQLGVLLLELRIRPLPV